MLLRSMVAVGALLVASPAQAAGSGALRMHVELGCLGCGWTRVSITGTCNGLCADGMRCGACDVVGGGEAYTSSGPTCTEAGELYGDVTIGGQGVGFVVTWDGPHWRLTTHDGTRASGVVVFAQPSGPCLGSGTGSFTGVVA